MARLNDWPVGERHAHHWQESERSQREQALAFRDHHLEDEHTVDGHYAAADEAFTRLDALERPSVASRLARLRKTAAARLFRRREKKAANWLVANGEHVSYWRRLMLHETFPDRYAKPTDSGFELADDDKAGIGPTAGDVWNECWAKVAESATSPSDVPTWMVGAYLQARRDGHTLAGRTATDIVDLAERLRTRARLMVALPKQPDSDVRDDYFEPKYWADGHGDDLRDYVRLACLGDPDDPESPGTWHTLAKTELAQAEQDDDFIAMCGMLRDAIDQEESWPVWEDAPETLPEVRVRVEGKKVTALWTGTLPSFVSVRMGVYLAKDLKYLESKSGTGTQAFFKMLTNSGRAVIFVQFQRNDSVNTTAARTAGKVVWVGDIA